MCAARLTTIRLLLLSTLLVCSAPRSDGATASADGGYPATRQFLTAQIRGAMQQPGMAGLSIALIDDQTVVWARGFGYADRANGTAASARTLYRVGSITKLFTATAAMQLAEQGKMDIDWPLQTYLPPFSIKSRFANTPPITPRHLMTHHSGLPSDYVKGMWTTAAPEPFTSLVDKLADDYTAYPPNLILSYSNVGVSLLGHAVANACGATYEVCVKTGLLDTLGMADSGLGTGPSASPLMAKAYQNGQEAADPLLRDVPAGGLNSSVLDLSRFVRMVFAGGSADGRHVVAGETLAEMLRPQNEAVPLDLDERVGLAWFLTRSASGETIAWHNGGTPLFHSMLAILPASKLGVVVLGNSDASAQVVDALALAALQSMAAEKGGTASGGLERTAAAAAAAGPADYAGYYVSADLGLVRIWKQSGQYRIRFAGQVMPLKQRADGSLVLRDPTGAKSVLTRADLSGRRVLIATSAGHRLLLGEKIDQAPLSAAWQQRLGNYHVANAGDDFPEFDFNRVVLDTQDGFLVLKVGALDGNGFAVLVLQPVSDTAAVVAGLGRGLGGTVAVESQGGEEVLRYSGYLNAAYSKDEADLHAQSSGQYLVYRRTRPVDGQYHPFPLPWKRPVRAPSGRTG